MNTIPQTPYERNKINILCAISENEHSKEKYKKKQEVEIAFNRWRV
jgi:hypothetical protein